MAAAAAAAAAAVAAVAGFPVDNQDISEHLALTISTTSPSRRPLARMAMVCTAWWKAARAAGANPPCELQTIAQRIVEAEQFIDNDGKGNLAPAGTIASLRVQNFMNHPASEATVCWNSRITNFPSSSILAS